MSLSCKVFLWCNILFMHSIVTGIVCCSLNYINYIEVSNLQIKNIGMQQRIRCYSQFHCQPTVMVFKEKEKLCVCISCTQYKP